MVDTQVFAKGVDFDFPANRVAWIKAELGSTGEWSHTAPDV